MLPAEHEKVVAHVQAGGLAKIISRTIDDFATFRKDDDGVWWISSQVWAESKLIDMRFWDLSFFKRVELA